jgi:hypothetical protein
MQLDSFLSFGKELITELAPQIHTKPRQYRPACVATKFNFTLKSYLTLLLVDSCAFDLSQALKLSGPKFLEFPHAQKDSRLIIIALWVDYKSF